MDNYLEDLNTKIQQQMTEAVELDNLIQQHIQNTAEKLTKGVKGGTLCRTSVEKGCALAWVSRLTTLLDSAKVKEITEQLENNLQKAVDSKKK
jgi:hypothetical protein